MKPLHIAIAMTALLPLSAHAQQMYKCSVAGRVTFSEFPCGPGAQKISVRPASGDYAPAPLAVAPAGVSAAVPAAAADSRQAVLDEMSKQRRIRELQYEIRDAENDMDEEIDRLRARQGQASNNLAGATWLAGISQEMQAVTAKWRGKLDELNSRLAALRKE